MKVTGLFLAGDQLVPGMTVAVARGGRLVVDDENIPLVLRALLDLRGNLRLFWVGIWWGLSRSSYPLSGAFEEDIRFMPVKVFTPAEAPDNTKYAVLVDGRCVRSGGRRQEAITVVKSGRGFCLEGQSRQYTMPAGAKLTPVS